MRGHSVHEIGHKETSSNSSVVRSNSVLDAETKTKLADGAKQELEATKRDIQALTERLHSMQAEIAKKLEKQKLEKQRLKAREARLHKTEEGLHSKNTYHVPLSIVPEDDDTSERPLSSPCRMSWPTSSKSSASLYQDHFPGKSRRRRASDGEGGEEGQKFSSPLESSATSKRFSRLPPLMSSDLSA